MCATINRCLSVRGENFGPLLSSMLSVVACVSPGFCNRVVAAGVGRADGMCIAALLGDDVECQRP